MKTFQKLLLLPALAMAFQLGAATNDVGNFSGTVVDAQGNPVANATLSLYQYPSRSAGLVDLEISQHATTDSQGAFAFPALQGMGVLLATKTGSPPAWRTFYSASKEPQKIVLATSSVLAGVVLDQAGRPVAEAEVWVASAVNKSKSSLGQPDFVFGRITHDLFSVKTSADGKFRLENFPADAQALLAVKKDGQALRPAATTPFAPDDQLPFHAGQQDITLTLEPAGSVSGTLVVRGTGQPLASAAVGLQLTAQGMEGFLFSSGQGTVVSAADGSFRIPDVPAGSYQIEANFTNEPVADWVVDPVPATVAAGEAVSGVKLQADKGGVVQVIVRAKGSHAPLPNTSVSVNGDNINRFGSTGTNGVVYFRLPAGNFSLYANQPDWSGAQSQSTVTEGQTTQVTIELAASLKVAGIVRDAAGVPVAGARVAVVPSYSQSGADAKTRADGHYELSWQKPDWGGGANQSFYLFAHDSERKLAAIQEMDEAATNLDVTLMPAMSLSGRVQDATGKAITNAAAYVMYHQENASFGLSRQPVIPDEQGRIHMDALPLGERYGWFVSAEGYGTAQQQMDAADPKADHHDFPPIVLQRADRKLAGRVLGAGGKPVAGAQIWINGENQPNRNATTDASGRFAFDGVCAGAVSVNANTKGASGSAQAMGGDTNIVIRLDEANHQFITAGPPKTLTGTVYDPSGHPAASARVVVTPSWGQVDTAKTDANGEYSINWQPQPGMRPITYSVIARLTEQNLAAIEPVSTNQTSVTLRLEPGLTISGTVQDANGAPLAHANINLNIMAGNQGGMVEYQGIKIGSDGSFTIPALPMGQRYMVHATANGYGSGQRNVGINQSQTNHLQLAPFKLKAADRLLAGQVVGEDGKPLAGAQVNIFGMGQPNGFMRTDEAGHFHFKVCGGTIQVMAWSQSGSGRNNSGSVQAHGGDTNLVLKMGVQQQQNQAVAREIPLQPQPWTLNALVSWPGNHKAATVVLISLQAAVLLGTAGGIFRFARKRGQRQG